MANKKQFTLVFDATMNVEEVKKSISEMQKALNGVNLSKSLSSSVTNTFKKLIDELDNYEAITSQAATSMNDIKKADKSLQTILSLFEKINNVAKEISTDPINFVNQEDLKKINAAKKALEGAKNALSNTAIAAKKANLQQQFDEAKKKVDGLSDQISELNKEVEGKKNKKIALSGQLQEAKDKLNELKKELNNLQSNPIKAQTKTTAKDGVRTTKTLNADELEGYKNKVADTKRQIDEVRESIEQLNKDISATDSTKAEKEIADLEKKSKEATDSMNALGEKIKHLKKDTKIEAVEKLRNELADLTGLAKKDIPTTIDGIEKFIQTLEEVKKAEIQKALDQLNKELEETGRQGRVAGEGLNRTTEEGEELSRTAQDIENLKNQILNFFSISNSIELFKRAINSAIDTVKELDAVMTETAVVTEFDIGDMWDKLPQYSSEASKLGTSISDLYGATTLYYQQGLKTNAAMGVGVETMKMARVANMNAEEATTAMTAALRGFNMEVNELNAQRVNDVYSELAAITAADTSQIATAMGKTASIAASANMEFETTAALLAQIIETTQEAPETAGTALKTIIARFSEVKSLQNQGLSTGKDTEGEDIDVNKIQTALRTVGISMNEFFAGTEGLDSVLLRLAEKWNELDFTTQRYIATTAAGSRQQSRFIAMMSNYERTTELVSAANDSAGASQRQFNKTLDSLDAKLQKLENAWKSFVMGIANDEFVKAGVDTLTWILESINKLTDALSGGNGLIKSIANLGVAFMGLKIGKNIFEILLPKMLGNFATKDSNSVINEIIKLFDKSKKENKGSILGSFFEKVGSDYGPQQVVDNLDEKVSNLGKTFQNAGSKASNFWNQLKGKEKFGTQLKGAVNTAVYVAAIALIVSGIVSIAKAWEEAKNANEKAIEDMEKASSEFASQLQDAKQELVAITDERDDLRKLQKELDGLARGTDEWKRKLVETNSAVLDLLDKYPELAAYITQTNGALSIQEAGWSAMTASALQKQYIAASGQTAARIRRTEAEKQKTVEESQSDFAKAAYQIDEFAGSDAHVKGGALIGGGAGALAGSALLGSGATALLTAKFAALGTLAGPLGTLIGAAVGAAIGIAIGVGGTKLSGEIAADEDTITKGATGLNKNDYMAFAAASAEKGLGYAAGTERGEYEELFRSMGLEGDFAKLHNNITQMGADFDKLSTSALKLKNTQDIYIDQLISQIAGENNKVSSFEYREQVEELVSGTSDDYGEKLDEAAQKITDNRDYVTKEGEATETLITDYASLMGIQKDEVRAKIADSSLSVETMATALAQQNLGEEISEELTKVLYKIPRNNEKLLNILSSEGRKTTRENLQNIDLEKLKNANTIEERNKEIANLFGLSGDAFNAKQWQVIFNNLSASVERFETATIFFREVTGVSLASYEQLNRLDSETLSTLVGNLQDVAVARGKGAANSVARGLNELLSGVTDKEDLNIITSLLDTIDWSNIDEVRGLSEKIQSLGLNSNIAKEKIDAFENIIIQATNAVKKFSMEKVLEELAKTEVLESDLREREPNNMVFTAEQVKDFLDINPDLAKDFYQTGSDEYVYIGDTLEALNQALWENKKAILDNTDALIGRKRAEVIDKIQDEGFNLKTVTATPQAITTYKQYVSPQDYADPAAYAGALLGTLISYGSFGYEEVIGTKYVKEWGNEQSDAKDILTKMANGEVLITDEDKAEILEAGKSYLSREDALKIFNALNPSGDVSSLDNEQLRQEIINLVNSTGTQEDYDTLFQLMHSSLNPTSLLQIGTNFNNPENSKKLIEDLKAQARAAHVSEALIQEFEKALSDSGGNLTVEIAAILANAIESETTEKSIQQAAKYANNIFSKYNDINQMTDEDISNIGLAFDLEEMYKGGEGFGLIEQQLINIEKALKGDTKALEQFQQALANTSGLDLKDGLIDVWNLSDGQGRLENGATELVNELLKTGLFKIQTVVASQAGKYYSAIVNEAGKIIGYDFKNLDAGDSYTTVAAVSGLDWMNALENFKGNDFEWENPYDKYYETVQDINAELRERERLEKEYQRLVKRTNSSALDLKQNREQRLTKLESERELREGLLDKRKRQMSDLEVEYSKFSKYARYDENTGTIDMNWNLINKLEESGDEKTVQALEKYISKLEEYQGYIQEQEDALEEIKDTVYDIYQEGKDEYFELENQIKDALVEARQKEIDKLTAIDNSINETNSKILSSMQESITRRRQERDNEKTEQDLDDKRRRLMYLQMDTSNANDLEILKLQEEIAEGEEDYTDQLVDQKISELQEQNDKAAEQRQRQIEILEAQLDYYQKYDVWEDVGGYIEELRANGGNIAQTSLAEILENTEGYKILSELQKKNWFEDIQRAINGAISWMELNNIPVPTGTKYASGGLASFTGPAWLDGTKSRPEYVLNASQTQAFLSLVDVLEYFGHGFNSTSTENFGDNIIDIDINIETVKEEADIDMLAEKIEQSIVKSARYRNNNFVQR